MSTRLLPFSLVAVALIAACGGGTTSDDGPPVPPHTRAGLTLTVISFNNDLGRVTFSGDTWSVTLAAQTAEPRGSIDVKVPIHWTNSAGGAGDTVPEEVNCQSMAGCQLVWGAEIPLQTGTNHIVITAAVPGGSPETVSVTVIRQ